MQKARLPQCQKYKNDGRLTNFSTMWKATLTLIEPFLFCRRQQDDKNDGKFSPFATIALKFQNFFQLKYAY